MKWFTEGDRTALGFIAACAIIWLPIIWKSL